MDIQTKDGILLRNVPDGTPDEVIQARIAKIRGGNTPEAPQSKLNLNQEPPNSIEEVIAKYAPSWMADSRATRGILQGAADPAVGLTQLAANTPAGSLLGADKVVNQFVNDKEKEYQAQRNDTGLDLSRIGGNVLGSILPTSKVGAAATTAGRIGQGAAIGAASGAANPVTGEDGFWSEKAMQTLLGGTLGGLVPGAWELAKAGGRGIRNVAQSLTPEGVDKVVGRQWNLNAGNKRDEIIKLLENYKPPVSGAPLSAGQVAAPANRAEVAALQQLGENANASLFSGEQGLNKAQSEARRKYLDTIAQVGTNAKEDTLRALRDRTLPDRLQALDNANIAGVLTPKLEADIAEKAASKISAMRDAGQLATGAAQQQRLADTFTPVAGQPRVAGRISENIDRVPEYAAGASDATKIAAQRRAEQAFNQTKLDSVSAEGFSPLKTNQLTEPLDKLLTTPGPEASDLMQKSIGAVNDKFKSLSRDGVINAHNLDTIRKELGTTIKNAIMKPDGTWDAKWAAGQEIKIKKSIDDAINKAAGDTKYTDSLKNYAIGMKDVNDITIGRELDKALVSGTGQEREAAFMNAVKNATQTPDMLRGNGVARVGNIDEAMTQRGQDVKNNLMKEFASQRNFEDLAKGGMSQATKNIGVGMPEITPTGMFNPKLSVARALINRFIGNEHGKVLARSGEASVDPKLIGKLMQDAKPFERQAIIDELMKLQAAGIGQQP